MTMDSMVLVLNFMEGLFTGILLKCIKYEDRTTLLVAALKALGEVVKEQIVWRLSLR